MKKTLLTLVSLGVFLSPILASAAPVVTRDTRWFDSQIVDHGKKLNVTGRVIDGSIVADVVRVQTVTIDGKRVPMYPAIDANMSALVVHCHLSRRADEATETECKYKPVVRYFPTISQ